MRKVRRNDLQLVRSSYAAIAERRQHNVCGESEIGDGGLFFFGFDCSAPKWMRVLSRIYALPEMRLIDGIVCFRWFYLAGREGCVKFEECGVFFLGNYEYGCKYVWFNELIILQLFCI